MLFHDLTDVVRRYMVEEVAYDIGRDRLYIGKLLSPQGKTDYAALIASAVSTEDLAWLTTQLQYFGRLLARAPYKNTTREVSPPYAAAMLAEGEFNRFYMRGLCRLVLATAGSYALVVYRAKQVKEPRSGSEELIGTYQDAEALLRDLRDHVGGDTYYKVPGGPNSGLSVKLVSAAQIQAA